MTALRAKTDTGKEIVDEMTQGYDLLNKNVTDNYKHVQNVVNSLQEQEEGISIINEAINEIDLNTQKQAVVAEEVSAIAKQSFNVAKKIVSNTHSAQFEGKDDLKIKDLKNQNFDIDGDCKRDN